MRVNEVSHLADAVLSGALELSGDLESLVAFHEGLMLYLAGAVRSLEFPRLLEAFRRQRPSGQKEGSFQ